MRPLLWWAAAVLLLGGCSDGNDGRPFSCNLTPSPGHPLFAYYAPARNVNGGTGDMIVVPDGFEVALNVTPPANAPPSGITLIVEATDDSGRAFSYLSNDLRPRLNLPAGRYRFRYTAKYMMPTPGILSFASLSFDESLDVCGNQQHSATLPSWPTLTPRTIQIAGPSPPNVYYSVALVDSTNSFEASISLPFGQSMFDVDLPAGIFTPYLTTETGAALQGSGSYSAKTVVRLSELPPALSSVTLTPPSNFVQLSGNVTGATPDAIDVTVSCVPGGVLLADTVPGATVNVSQSAGMYALAVENGTTCPLHPTFAFGLFGGFAIEPSAPPDVTLSSDMTSDYEMPVAPSTVMWTGSFVGTQGQALPAANGRVVSTVLRDPSLTGRRVTAEVGADNFGNFSATLPAGDYEAVWFFLAQ